MERLLDGYRHACSAAAISGVLNQLPRHDVEGLGLVVMHQPTRKQEVLSPAWGRICWCDRFRGYSGPVVMLDAIDLSQDWLGLGGRSVSVEWRRELERMHGLGLTVEEDQRGHWLELKPELVRRWLLVRTLPHEVGHWVDFRRQVLEPLGVPTVTEAIDHPEYGVLIDRWYARPEREREEFADRYATDAEGVVLRYLDTCADLS